MKLNLNKIVLNFAIILFFGSCHTLEHQNFFLDTKKRHENQNKKIDNLEEKNTKTIIDDIDKEKHSNKIEITPIDGIDKEKNSNKIEIAPIKVPEQKKKVKTVVLRKKLIVPKTKIFEINTIKNWSEKKLIQKLGQSDFIKEEGKLKSYQYYFSSCFLDVYFLKKKDGYYVKHVQTRSTKLYGIIEPEKCLKEISNRLR